MAFTKYSNIVLEVAKDGDKPDWLKITNNTKEIDKADVVENPLEKEILSSKNNKGE